MKTDARPRCIRPVRPGLVAIVAIVAIAIASLALAAPAAAQVNTERLRSKKVETGLHGYVEGAMSFQAGNTSLLFGSLGARLELQRGVHNAFIQGSYAVGVKNDETFIHNGFLHARWTAMWHRLVGSELFSQIQFDDILLMHLRALVGAGVRARLVHNRRLWIYLGSGYMLEYEDLSLAATDPHPKTTVNHRWTSYLLLRIFFTSWLRLVATTYAQPRFDDFSDFRFLEDLSVVLKVRKWLSLHLNLVFAYDSRPPAEIRGMDVRTLTKLRVSW